MSAISGRQPQMVFLPDSVSADVSVLLLNPRYALPLGGNDDAFRLHGLAILQLTQAVFANRY
jgi:hypothetical protein